MSDRFRRHCRALRLATQIVFWGLVLLVLTGAAGLPHWPSGVKLPESFLHRLALFAVQALPAIGYLCEYSLLERYRLTTYACAARVFP